MVSYADAALPDYLRDDCDRDLLRRFRANIDSERRVNLLELVRRYAALCKPLEHRAHPPARTDHPDESAIRGKCGAHHFFVVRVPARDRHQAAVAIERERGDRRCERLHDQLIGAGKALAVRKCGSIVDHGHVKSKHRAERRKRLRDMPRARDDQPLRADDWVNEYPRRAV